MSARWSAPLLALALAACGATSQPPDADTSADAGGERADGAIDLDGGGSPCHAWPTDRPLRVLFVGNSQVAFWDLARLVSSVSESAHPSCPRIAGESFWIAGANLGSLWTEVDLRGRTLPPLIEGGGYDVVVIAESIDLVEVRPPYPEQFVTDATRVVEAARASGALPILYATGYVELPDHTGFREMADPQIALGAALDVTVAAGGLAWLRVWAREPAADLYFTDRAHPGFHGSYVSALVIWSAITGGDPHGLTATPATDCMDVGCAPIGADQAALYQTAAWEQHLETGL